MPFGWRPDGDRVRELPLTRRIMPFIMPTRNESVVYFEQKLDSTKLQAFLSEARAQTEHKVTLLHVLIWAVAQTLDERPRLNRFVAGRRIYARRGIWISFSAKKEKSDRGSIVVVKRCIDPAWSLAEVVDDVQSAITEGRSEKKSTTDKELNILLRLPTGVLGLFVRFQMLLDRLGLLPGAFYRNDPMYGSVFIANLGSLNMEAGFHHLYEYGDIPIFATVGRIQDEVIAGEDGEPTVRPMLTIRYSFDERIEDGLYCAKALDRLRDRLEDPATFGALRAP